MPTVGNILIFETETGKMQKLVDNHDKYEVLRQEMCTFQEYKPDELAWKMFSEDLYYRLSWNSNALEGNTISLEETVSLLEYDEVRSGHTFTEYQEAKSMYATIKRFLTLANSRYFDEADLKEMNAMIRGRETSDYRNGNNYVGTLLEVTYVPPDYTCVPEKMKKLLADMRDEKGGTIEEQIQNICEQHILFERIHPFWDGNGRTGRLLMSQQLANSGALPAIILDQGKYRQAFRRYDRNKDISLMENVVLNGILESYKNLSVARKKVQHRKRGR